MYSPKENYLRALRHESTDYTPVEGFDYIYAGFDDNAMEKGPRGGGKDGFGVEWATPDSGGGAAVPAPVPFLLDDETICEWRDYVTIPDPTKHDWQGDMERQLAGVDREVTAIGYEDGNGPYERLAALLGFENALVAMAIEPEAVNDLLTAVTDYKIACLDIIKEVYDPDVYTLYDDCATQLSPFMSPETYRDLIKPHHKRIADRVKELDIIPMLHCCGHAEMLVEDFIEEGFAGWSSVQPCNDIVSLCNKYGDHFTFNGGYDTVGAPGMTWDVDVISAEIDRCLDEYGGLPGYILLGFIMNPLEEGMDPSMVMGMSEKLIEIAQEHSVARALEALRKTA